MDRSASRTAMLVKRSAAMEKQTAAPAAADEAEVIDLVGTSGDEDEAQGMITQRPSRINIKREHAVESVAYDVGTVCNETDHSQENNRPNSVERNSVESLINTFVNAREMMEEKLKQLRQEWKTCHERYKYACARGFYADDRDGREDRAIDNMRRIETDIDNLTSKLRNDQPGRNVAAAVMPVAQQNDELAEEAEIGSSDKDRGDDSHHNGAPQYNNPNDDTQESSMEGPFHPLGTKHKAKTISHDELNSVESDGEVEDESSNEESHSDGKSFHDETPQNTSESLRRTRYPIRSHPEKLLQVYEGVDLTGVPKLPPIKSKKHGASSKYQGVSFRNGENKWEAKISVNGWKHTIGCYDDEREAAVDYARAVFKYRGGNKSSIDAIAAGKSVAKSKRAEGRVSAKRPSQQMKETSAKGRKKPRVEKEVKFVDLTDVPYQRPILRDDSSGTSRYVGVTLNNIGRNGWRWRAKIGINKKQHTIGYYDNEREAAVDYARALFKYRGGNAQGSSTKAARKSVAKSKRAEGHVSAKRPSLQMKESGGKGKKKAPVEKEEVKFVDLTYVPYQQPILRDDTSGTSRYVGVILYNKGENCWRAQIKIDGKRHIIGYYDNERKAAVDYARAVFKYRGGNAQSSDTKAAGKLSVQKRASIKRRALPLEEGKSKKKSRKNFLDLSDVPYQRPIPKCDGRACSSKYKGVSYEKKCNKWRADIIIDGKKYFLGYYNHEEEAAVEHARAVYKYVEESWI